MDSGTTRATKGAATLSVYWQSRSLVYHPSCPALYLGTGVGRIGRSACSLKVILGKSAGVRNAKWQAATQKDHSVVGVLTKCTSSVISGARPERTVVSKTETRKHVDSLRSSVFQALRSEAETTVRSTVRAPTHFNQHQASTQPHNRSASRNKVRGDASTPVCRVSRLLLQGKLRQPLRRRGSDDEKQPREAMMPPRYTSCCAPRCRRW